MQTELIITVAAAVICYPSIRQQLTKYLGMQLLHGSSPLACSQCCGNVVLKRSWNLLGQIKW